MKIAVTSQNLRTVTPHAGRTRRFLVYDVAAGQEPVAAGPIELAKELTMHAWHGSGAHPLDGVDVLIAGSCGAGFARRLADRGIVVVTTDKTDPLEAVNEYMTRGERAATDRRIADDACRHHQHEHRHGHRHGCERHGGPVGPHA